MIRCSSAGESRFKAAFLALILTAVLLLPAPCRGSDFQEVRPGDAVALPRDLFLREEFKVQWWYLTGHLTDDEGSEYGYQVTFFVVGVQRGEAVSRFSLRNIHIVHFAVTDLRGKRFLFSDRADSGAFGFAGALPDRLKVWVGRSVLQGTSDGMLLSAADQDKGLDLALTPLKPPVLHGQRGYSRKSGESPLIASLYFSYTRMKSAGTLRINGRSVSVRGESWFDRELSTRALGSGYRGWDWFSLRLDDGREVMLYIVRKADNTIDSHSSGTVVMPDGSYRTLRREDMTISATGYFTSGKTKARYPSRWRITIPSEGLSLEVSSLLPDQEAVALQTTFNVYWEGICRVAGTATGVAYVELTGYDK